VAVEVVVEEEATESVAATEIADRESLDQAT